MGISNRKGTVPLLDLLHKQPKPAAGPRSGDASGNGTAAQGPATLGANGAPLGKPVVRIELKPRESQRAMTPIKVQPLVLPGKSTDVREATVGEAVRAPAQPHVIPASAAAGMALQAPSPLPTLVPTPSREVAANALDSPMTRPASELPAAGVGISPALISKLAIGVLGLGVVALLVYVVGYRLGGSDKKKELEPILRAGVPAVVEPGAIKPSGTQPIVTPPAPTRSASETKGAGTSAAKPTARPGAPAGAASGIVLPTITPGMFENPPPPAAGVLTNMGWLTVDPREAGKNYLILAERLSRNEAGEAVFFLAANGVQAFAVPLDKTGAQAKNPSRDFYVLYAGPGVTKEFLPSLDGSNPTDLQRSVARLGSAYRKEMKGETDFNGAYYELYRPGK